jgi:hypothetical protein
MSRFALACCCAFAVGLAPAGAQTPAPSPVPAPAASAPSPEAAKIAAAMSKVTSFRVQLSSTGGFGGTITVMVPQKRTKAVVAMGTTVNEMVMADGHTYSRINGGEWRPTEAPGGGAGFADSVLKAMGDPSKFRVLPDRMENGTAVGVYEVTVPLSAVMPAGMTVPPLTCTYDKVTYLPRVCTIQSMTQTFEGWNDPANVIDVPVVASPAPAASPRP